MVNTDYPPLSGHCLHRLQWISTRQLPNAIYFYSCIFAVIQPWLFNFLSFLCLAHDIFWELARHFFVHASGQNVLFILSCYPVQSVFQKRLWEWAYGGGQCCSVLSATLGTSGKDHSCQGSRDSMGIHCNTSLPQLILKYLVSNCSQWNDNGKGIHCTLLVRELILLEQNLSFIWEQLG